MRLSSYFADAGEVFIYNLCKPNIHEFLDGEYLIVYRQSVGGRYPPKAFPPTSDRHVKIAPFKPDQNPVAGGSFMRFNQYFRTIRDLIIYPTSRGDKFANMESPLTGQNNTSQTGYRGLMAEEAGVRFSLNPKSCQSFEPEDFADAHPQTRDSRLEYLFQTVDAIRTRGSTISFGMVVNNSKSSGYEFCQVEFAPPDGEDRTLIVGIKIPDVEKVSSLYIKEQPILEYMYEFVEQHFLGTDNGYFIVKEYGAEVDERSDTTPVPQRRREFSSFELEEGTDRERLRDYTCWVANSCIDGKCFNAGVFEEWRHSIPSLTVNQQLRNLHQVYTMQKQAVVEEIELLQLKLRELKDSDDCQIETLTGLSDKIAEWKLTSNILQDAQVYVAERRKGQEFEIEREYRFGLMKRAGKKATASVTKPSTRTSHQSESESDSSTSSSSSQSGTTIVGLGLMNKTRKNPTETGSSISISPDPAQSGTTIVGPDSEDTTLKQALLSILKGTEKAASSTPLRKSDSRNNVSSRRLLEEEEEDLRQNLLTIVTDKVKENSPDPEEYGGAILISSSPGAEHTPTLPPP